MALECAVAPGERRGPQKNQEKTKRVYSERVFLSGNIKWINFLHAVAFEKRSDFFLAIDYRIASFVKFSNLISFWWQTCDFSSGQSWV